MATEIEMTATLAAEIKVVASNSVPRVSRPHSHATTPPPATTRARKVHGLKNVAPSAKAARPAAERTRSRSSRCPPDPTRQGHAVERAELPPKRRLRR